MSHIRLYTSYESEHEKRRTKIIKNHLEAKSKCSNLEIKLEYCYHIVLPIENDKYEFMLKNKDKLEMLLIPNVFESQLSQQSSFNSNVIEIGPRISFKTAFCTNAIAILNSVGISNVVRIERSRRYSINLSDINPDHFLELAGDKMTEFIYPQNICFHSPINTRESIQIIDILSDHNNLKKANIEMGLAFDDDDMQYYINLYSEKLKRNPTDVELFDLAQSDSEHSRHWFFNGILSIDGNPVESSLMKMVKSTLNTSNPNSIIAFCDNSSAIKGFGTLKNIIPIDSTITSAFSLKSVNRHIIYSAETHNFPTAVCPFQGATTGTGGRIRDIHSTGKGAHEIAGVAGYSVGNLNLDGYKLPWESVDENEEAWEYPSGFSHPRQIIIDASNGASDYGNKFGEPVICGFTRSFGLRLHGQRYEYAKPIMFSGGVGTIDNEHVKKVESTPGHILAKIGGPVYRIGVGGGAASSLAVQGSRNSELDFSAVQRGDAEMAQKLHRIVRSCTEMSESNPILAIHDQGAGGNGNVLRELVENRGAAISANAFELGDPTISARELWTAEYQESDAALIDKNLVPALKQIARREKCSVSFVGEVNDSQKLVVTDFDENSQIHPVEHDLRFVGSRERKKFNLTACNSPLSGLVLPSGLTVREALNRVLRLPSVSSKRYLTCKVDRSVTGLIAQQQCVGPLHTPVADVSVVALSHFSKVGAAVSVGEQPIKGLVNPEAGARMTLAECLTNLVFAPITSIKDIKMSGNWMWAAKCEGEGARLVRACTALCSALKEIGCAIDGGKDSLSMAARVGDDLVKAPGTIVVSAYVGCTDITKTITPVVNVASTLIYVGMGNKVHKSRLGGSALAQCFKQIGNECPDVGDFVLFAKIFETIQQMIKDGIILAGHDVSDGGIITSLLEIAFSSNTTLISNVNNEAEALSFWFSEEAGVILAVKSENLDQSLRCLEYAGASPIIIGTTEEVYGPNAIVKIAYNEEAIVNESLTVLREIWEDTSYQLGLLQTTKKCLDEEKEARSSTSLIKYVCNFEFDQPSHILNNADYFASAPKMAIIREEGSNGDREMAAAFALAGFQTFDVTMTDLIDGHSLSAYRGIAFVGGFSYGDVFGSARGWAATIKFHELVADEFKQFYSRNDTFSFGVCNGCQLMAQLGWIGQYENESSVFLNENSCGRFESYFGPVRIEESPSIMLKGMHGSILGLWSSHGEGRFTFKSDDAYQYLKPSVSIRYVNAEGHPTEQYPWNPNGSIDGIAGMCSEDGRHLAIMPHSDRAFISWQWPSYPTDPSFQPKTENNEISVSPWIQMFRNAYDWVISDS